MRISKTFIFHALLLVCVCCICYVNTLHHPFIWDDESLIVHNHLLRDWRNIPRFFSGTAWPTDFSNFYRPLQLVSYTVDYFFWQLRPCGYHITSILLHALNGILVYTLLLLVLGHRGASFLGSLFFTVHPVHTEAVTYIAGRADLLVSFFILIFFIVYMVMIRNRSRISLFFLLLFSYGCALLSKEIALVVPCMVLFWHIVLYRKEKRTLLVWSLMSTGCITLIYYMWRIHAGSLEAFDIYAFSFLERLSVATKSFALYCLLVVAPLRLHMEYMIFPPDTFLHPLFIASVLVVICFLVALIVTCRRSKVGTVALVWFMVMVLPVLNLVPLNATFAEHWLYLPLIGLSLGIGAVIKNAKRVLYRNSIMSVIIVCVVLFSVRTVVRNNDWQDPIRFYKQTLRLSPHNIKVLYNLGIAYIKKDKADEALIHFREIVRIVTQEKLMTQGKGAHFLLTRLLTKTYNNMGYAYAIKEDYEKALSCYQQSVRLTPDQKLNHLNMALLYRKMGKREEARDEYAIVLRLDPHDERAQMFLEALDNQELIER